MDPIIFQPSFKIECMKYYRVSHKEVTYIEGLLQVLLRGLFKVLKIQIIILIRSTRFGHLIVYQFISTICHFVYFINPNSLVVVMSKSSESLTSKATDCGQTMDGKLKFKCPCPTKYNNLYQSSLKEIL